MFKVERIHKKILKYLRSSKIEIAFIFTCPHHPDEKCKCRKPNTELGELAIQKFNIDLKNSYMIGDQESDLQFGLALGLTVIQLKGSAIKSPFADHYSDTLMDAAMWITKR
jgi:histidinol-phosphate phosphatase family protein